FFVQDSYGPSKILSLLFSGYESDTGVDATDSFLSRGGMESMFFSISLLLLALGLGGLLFNLGILTALLDGIQHLLKRVSVLMGTTALAAIGVNLFVGEQYLSILHPGHAFQEAYQKAGLHPKNLARVLEDAGSV